MPGTAAGWLGTLLLQNQTSLGRGTGSENAAKGAARGQNRHRKQAPTWACQAGDSPDPSATAGGAPCPGHGTDQGPSSPSSPSRCAHSHVFREKWRFSVAGAAAARAEGSAWPSRYWMERSWKQGSASITAVARSALQRDITVRLCPLPTPSCPHPPGQAPGCVPRHSTASWVLQELWLALRVIAAVKWEPQGAPALRSPQRLCSWGQTWGTVGHTQGSVLLLARSKAAEGHPPPPPPLPPPCSGSLRGSIGYISTC